MIIFIYGPDTYRSHQKLNEIVEHYKKIYQQGLNLKRFNLENASFKDFKDEIQQISMFKGKKLIILINAFSNSEFKEKFKKDKQFFKEIEDVILFYEDKKILESDSFTKFLKKQGESQKFELLEGQKLSSWVREEFKKRQTEIAEFGLSQLINFAGNDTWRLSNEIEKLVLYKAGKSKIEANDVEILVAPKIKSEIFETIDLLAKREKTRALELIQKHLEKGDSPFYLLSMINFQFRNLIMIKSYGPSSNLFNIGPATGMHPFVIKKTIDLAKGFSFEELKKSFQKIFEADLAMKSGKVGAEEGLKMLVADI